MFSIKRSEHNPIIRPDTKEEWQSQATFNGCPIDTGRDTHILYRALGKPRKFESTVFSLSTIGIAKEDPSGVWINRRQFITPEEPWEKYGCEDPRVTYLDGNYYIFYTALGLFPFRGDGIKVAIAVSKDLKTVKERHMVTPFNAKAMSFFPSKVDGKYTVIFAANTDDGSLAKISIAQFSKIEDVWDHDKWRKWYEKISDYTLQIPKKDGEQVEIGAPPIKTPYGWLLIYSHIQNYFSDNKIFGICAVLLDTKDPRKVIAQTKTPFIVPEASYEKDGIVPRVTFPSGAILEEDTLRVFYGGADTVCACAEMSLTGLLAGMEYFKSIDIPTRVALYKKNHTLLRIGNSPMIAPRPDHPWESRAVFNPGVLEINGVVYILYRAMSEDNTSVIGYVESHDVVSINVRNIAPVYTPRAPFEEKRIPGGNSGCEDPRLVLIDGRVYMTYTAYNGVDLPHIALTSISVDDFVNGIWKWKLPILISKDGVDDKDGALFPAKIKDKYALIHRVNHDICIDYSETLEFKNRNEYKDKVILEPRVGMWDSRKVGIAMPPIISPYGWILIYHGIGDDGVYRVGAALLDMSDAEKVIARSAYPIFEPETDLEKHGQINNVVFPCGAIVKKDSLYIYYGEADTVIGVATITIKNILESLGVV